jgi:hypothetical protein
LTQALASPQVAHVTTLSRRPPYSVTEGSKLSTIIIPSTEYPRGFEEFSPSLVEKLKAEGHTGVIWALGISQTQVNKEQYIQYVRHLIPIEANGRITHDYTLAAARAFQQLGTPEKPFSFVFISGDGADQAEKSWTLFGKIKGRTEKALAEMSSESFKTVSLRPGAILMTEEVSICKMTISADPRSTSTEWVHCRDRFMRQHSGYSKRSFPV